MKLTHQIKRVHRSQPQDKIGAGLPILAGRRLIDAPLLALRAGGYEHPYNSRRMGLMSWRMSWFIIRCAGAGEMGA